MIGDEAGGAGSDGAWLAAGDAASARAGPPGVAGGGRPGGCGLEAFSQPPRGLDERERVASVRSLLLRAILPLYIQTECMLIDRNMQTVC